MNPSDDDRRNPSLRTPEGTQTSLFGEAANEAPEEALSQRSGGVSPSADPADLADPQKTPDLAFDRAPDRAPDRARPLGLAPNPTASAFVAPPTYPSSETAQGVRGDRNPSAAAEGTLDERIVAALREIYDPEIPVNIYDLGLIYSVDCDDMGVVEIDMTLTTPGCPVAQTFPGVVEAAVQNVSGVAAAEVNLVWEPAWTIDRMSEAAKLELGFF